MCCFCSLFTLSVILKTPGVPKPGDINSQLGVRDNVDSFFSWSVSGCNNRQINGYVFSVLEAFEKSSVIYEPGAWDNASGLHWQLPRNTFLACHFAIQMGHHNTMSCKLERRHCNIAWHRVRHPNKLAYFQLFAQSLCPSSRYSGYPDLRLSGDRPCFFITNKSIQFIQFSCVKTFRSLCCWQLLCISIYPVWNTLLADLQYAPNSSCTVALHVHADGKHTGFGRVAIFLWLWRIGTVTNTTSVSLTSWTMKASFVLFLSW